MNLDDQISELFDDSDFVGVLVQPWHCSGADERERVDNGTFVTKLVGRDQIKNLFLQAIDDPLHISVEPLFNRPAVMQTHCMNCVYRDGCGYCTNRKISEDTHCFSLQEKQDSLIYDYLKGGGFWVGELFGCVHFTPKPQNEEHC